MSRSVLQDSRWLRRAGFEDPADLRARLGQSDPPTHVSLFAGIGGFDLGLHWAGFDTLVAVENDEHAADTYRLNSADWVPDNSPPVLIERNIRKVSTWEILDAADVGIGVLEEEDEIFESMVSTIEARHSSISTESSVREVLRLFREEVETFTDPLVDDVESPEADDLEDLYVSEDDRDVRTDGGTEVQAPAHDIHDLTGLQRDILVVVHRVDGRPSGTGVARRLQADADAANVRDRRVYYSLEALHRAGLIDRSWIDRPGHESTWGLTDDGRRLLTDLVEWVDPLASADIEGR